MKPTSTRKGVIKVSWNLSLMLPLDKAHQLQVLLTEATQYDETGYSEREKFAYFRDYAVPAVEIVPNNGVLFDATTLSSDDVTKWRDTVREGLEADKEAYAKDAVPPHLWEAMT